VRPLLFHGKPVGGTPPHNLVGKASVLGSCHRLLSKAWAWVDSLPPGGPCRAVGVLPRPSRLSSHAHRPSRASDSPRAPLDPRSLLPSDVAFFCLDASSTLGIPRAVARAVRRKQRLLTDFMPSTVGPAPPVTSICSLDPRDSGVWLLRWCRSIAAFGRMSGARIVPVGWLCAGPSNCRRPIPSLAVFPSVAFAVPLRGALVLPTRSVGAIRMKNGALRPAPSRRRRRTPKRPACSIGPSPVPLVHAGALCSRTQCMPWRRGDAPPGPSIRNDLPHDGRALAPPAPRRAAGGARRPGGLLPG